MDGDGTGVSEEGNHDQGEMDNSIFDSGPQGSSASSADSSEVSKHYCKLKVQKPDHRLHILANKYVIVVGFQIVSL